MENIDIVYVIKESDNNTDLKYSLRSLINVSGYNKVWFSGYCPTWTKPDGFIKTAQTSNKWLNSLENVITACKNDKIAENFALFNDDFFAINPVNLLTDINLCRGTLDEAIKKYSQERYSKWRDAHRQTKRLLTQLKCKYFDNFALHIPIIINRNKFLTLMDKQKIKDHIEIYRILSYRSVYGNMTWNNPIHITDIKLKKGVDITDEGMLKQWVSVRDNVTNNLDKYPKLKSILDQFPKSKYEV